MARILPGVRTTFAERTFTDDFDPTPFWGPTTGPRTVSLRRMHRAPRRLRSVLCAPSDASTEEHDRQLGGLTWFHRSVGSVEEDDLPSRA